MARKKYQDTRFEESNGFTWRVLFPSIQSASIGNAKPKATIDIDGELFKTPVSVAKKLVDGIDDGEVAPASRSEVLSTIFDLSLIQAKARIVKLASQREYSRKELEQKLSSDGFWSKVIQEALSCAERGNVLDDARFADIFIRTKLAAGWGTRKIEFELERKGIDPASVPGWPEEYLDGESELERAWDLMRFRSVPSKNPYEKIVRFLVAKGFSYSIAKEVAARKCNSDDDDAE